MAQEPSRRQSAQRVGRFTESVIREQSRIALEHGAINLAQGFPDFDPPAFLTEALHAVLTKGGHHQYANTWGAPEFRLALSRKISREVGRMVDPDRELTVTCGSTEAMIASMMAILDPGDRVAVFSPYYENYAADGILAGAEAVHVRLHAPHWRFDPEELRSAFRDQGCKALVLCNPSNPCGKVFTREELETIASILLEYDALAVTDEVYQHITYHGRTHIPLATLPDMADRVITCSSLSKTYSITGWRLGYVWASPRWTDAVRKVHDFLTVGAAHPLQMAAIAGLEQPESYYQELSKEYSQRLEILLPALSDAGIPALRPQGAYFLLADISSTGMGDVEFCQFMARELGVSPVPGCSFFEYPVGNLARFHFSRKDETLHEAARRLRKLPRML
ncbi:MAG: aminotransferase class I/II-fold pyridoxal phosphate-dependent enzyme [Fibrobacteres bacterium]|nr:aminotransferase class I/II-fold pyridoxal phosphate-dependent enzyme [Fibrobacterota bacterium]